MLKRKSCGVIVMVVLSAIVGTGIVLADDIIGICIAPATLNLNEYLGGECDDVTVHADISISLVDCSTLKLYDPEVTEPEVLSPVSYFADDRGDLVAKFNRVDVENIVNPGYVNLTLTGLTKNGDAFTGTDTIRVIDSGKTPTP